MFAILVPYFNEEQYISKLLLSLKEQVDKNFVVVFVDNLSTDKTREIILSETEYINKSWFIVESRMQGQIHTFKPGASFIKLKFPDIKYLATVDADSYFHDKYWTRTVNKAIEDSPGFGYYYGPRLYTELSDYPVLQNIEQIHNTVLTEIISKTAWIGFGHNTVYDIDLFMKASQSIVVNGGVFVACDLLTSLSVLLSGRYPSYFDSFVMTSGRRIIQSRATLEGFSFYDRNSHLAYLYSRTHLNPDHANEPAVDLEITMAEEFFRKRARKLAEQNFALLLVFERENRICESINRYFNIELDAVAIDRYKSRDNLNKILWSYQEYIELIMQLSEEKFVTQLEDAIYSKFMILWQKQST